MNNKEVIDLLNKTVKNLDVLISVKEKEVSYMKSIRDGLLDLIYKDEIENPELLNEYKDVERIPHTYKRKEEEKPKEEKLEVTIRFQYIEQKWNIIVITKKGTIYA